MQKNDVLFEARLNYILNSQQFKGRKDLKIDYIKQIILNTICMHDEKATEAFDAFCRLEHKRLEWKYNQEDLKEQ